MNELLYVLITLWGTFLIWDGIQEIRTKKYHTFHRASFFKRANKVVIESRNVIFFGIWHVFGGVVIAVYSINSLMQQFQGAFSFLFIALFVFVTVEIVLGMIFLRDFWKEYNQIQSSTNR